jgi:manganese/zinc/iron transport system ATP- binding protein
MAISALHINELTVAYNQKPVLWRINATIPQGVMLAMVGPNGAGKSTLIKTIVQLIKPLAGTIHIFDTPYQQQLHTIAYIPQRATIDWDFPITVLDVVLMGTYRSLGWCKRPGKKEYTQALDALAAVGIQEYATSPIGVLSGGQQQRVFLARALAQDAQLYLMDEPFIGVDTVTEGIVLSLLADLRSRGKTIVVVHHDLHTVTTYFDWVMLLNVHGIACGSRDTVFTDALVQATYGSSIILPKVQKADHASLF